MSDSPQPNPQRPSRRALLGWFGSIGIAAAFVAITGAIESYFSNVPSLFSWSPNRANRTPRPSRAKLMRMGRKAKKAHAASNTDLILVEHRDRSKRLMTSVVHWPHPLLIGRRLPLNMTHQLLKRDEWKKIVQPRCGKGSRWTKPSTTHFEAAHEAIMREHLALEELSFVDINQVHGLDEALNVLAPLFADDRNRCNWRAYYLYSRILCWQEPDPEQARSAILRTVWNRSDVELKPKQIAFLWSVDEFRKWHSKTRTAPFLRRLRKRTEFARSLRGGQSSSGQDTASAERDRSNRPRPLATKQRARIRKLKLARRRERRAAPKKITFWNRVMILWNRSTRQTSSGDLSRNTNGTPHKAHLLKAGRKNKRNLKCTISKRRQQCIPVAGRTLGGRAGDP